MTVIYKGKEIPINDKLLIERGVEHNLIDIIRIRNAIHNLFEAEGSGDFIGMESDILNQLESLEYQLQELWEFPPDENYHYRQFEFSRCTCPTMDNRERIGINSWIIFENCPYHGVTN